MKRIVLGLGVAFLVGLAFAGQASLESEFMNPPLEYATRPLWFWNVTTVTKEGVAEQIQAARDQSGYGGFGILPFKKGFKPTYLSDEYFEVYGISRLQANQYSSASGW